MVRTELASGIRAPGPAAAQPAQVAEAVVDSVRTRAAQVAVPRWVGALRTVAGLLPEPAQRLTRAFIRDDRGLEANRSAARADHLDRINRQAAGRGPYQ